MNRFWMGVLISVLCVGPAVPIRADEKPSGETVAQYLEKLQVQLVHTAQRLNQPTPGSSSVIGLRGSKQELSTSQKLYWKDARGKERPVTAEEVKALRAAIDLARAGKKDKAMADLNVFIEKHPSSPLVANAKEALHRLNEAPTSAPETSAAPAAAPAKPATPAVPSATGAH